MSTTDTPRIDDITIAILATNGFEQSELDEPLKRLRDAGADVHVVSPESGKIRGWKGTDWKDEVDVDVELSDADPARYDALVLPGGVINPDQLRIDDAALDFIRAFAKDEKPIAAVCHAPWLLVQTDLVDGRKVTSWPSVRKDLENAGAKWEDAEVVVDDFLITSRNPDDLPAFCAAIIATVAARGSAPIG